MKDVLQKILLIRTSLLLFLLVVPQSAYSSNISYESTVVLDF
jgi:hypothetical protein